MCTAGWRHPAGAAQPSSAVLLPLLDERSRVNVCTCVLWASLGLLCWAAVHEDLLHACAGMGQLPPRPAGTPRAQG